MWTGSSATKAFITGDVLEIQQNLYTQRFGQNLRAVHSFDIDPRCGSTFLCDLADSENILPSEAYDCLLLPCTLSLLREIELCLRNALRVLKPGGVLLANAAGLIPLNRSDGLLALFSRRLAPVDANSLAGLRDNSGGARELPCCCCR